MVPFFGIFHPGELPRRPSIEAPAKASFFGGGTSSEQISRLEHEVAYLYGKAPEPPAYGASETAPRDI
ncbi:hypothetical protein [Devosia sp. FJ2-5-3]|uniref:hypothetical protein n=1 Tax=Devosia sp. FJ2-5-3 TaxID=2976680 RepID=UPI0023D823B3|nr:hypothetical protein [Devosia sp. FJ2-5-3]WEJ57092.1 hypothetical protein N0P34_12850 [Devosia sp. FJ2-5-3]